MKDTKAKAVAPEVEVAKFQKISGGELEKFATQILKQMVDGDIPPTPANFAIYFEKLLDTRPAVFKKRIQEMAANEDLGEGEKRANMERDFKQSFLYVKGLLNTAASVHKNSNSLKELAKRKMDELALSGGSITVQNILKSLISDIDNFNAALDRQMHSMRGDFEELSNVYKKIGEQSEFDSKFDVYNKKYLLGTIAGDLDSIRRYGYATSVLFLRVKDAILNIAQSPRDKMALLRNASKLLVKTSRRSDVVAHWGDGIFAMEMKHTDINGGKKACERILDLFENTTFFLHEQEIEMKLDMSLIAVDPEQNIEASFELAVAALGSQQGEERFVVIEPQSQEG